MISGIWWDVVVRSRLSLRSQRVVSSRVILRVWDLQCGLVFHSRVPSLPDGVVHYCLDGRHVHHLSLPAGNLKLFNKVTDANR